MMRCCDQAQTFQADLPSGIEMIGGFQWNDANQDAIFSFSMLGAAYQNLISEGVTIKSRRSNQIESIDLTIGPTIDLTDVGLTPIRSTYL